MVDDDQLDKILNSPALKDNPETAIETSFIQRFKQRFKQRRQAKAEAKAEARAQGYATGSYSPPGYRRPRRDRAPRDSGGAIRWIFIILLIIILVVGFIWYSTTTTGSLLLSKSTASLAVVEDVKRDVQSPINQAGGLISGDINPEQLWSSKVQEQKYEGVEAGIEIIDLQPTRSVFLDRDGNGDNFAVTGLIKAVSLPEDTLNEDQKSMTVSISVNESSIELEKEKFPTFYCDSDSDEQADWNEVKTLIVEDSALDIFICKTKEKSFTLDRDAYIASLNIDYTFSVVAGKQTYVARQDELDSVFIQGTEPLDHFGIDEDTIRSWQSKSPVGIGFGVQGVERKGLKVLGANNNKNRVPYIMQFTVRNSGTGLLKQGANITIDVPAVIEHTGDDDFKQISNTEIGGILINTYESNRLPPVEPGLTANAIFEFRVPEQTFLAEQSLLPFFTRASMDFNYVEEDAVALEITRINSN